MAVVVKNPGWGDIPGGGNGNPLQYSCLEIPWTGEPGRLQSMGSQRHNSDAWAPMHTWYIHTVMKPWRQTAATYSFGWICKHVVERSQIHTIYGITPYIYIAPKWTKLTYGNRIQDGATAGLEVMGMGHEGYWGCCLLATVCFFLLTFCSWFKWICSLCNN